MRQQAKWRRLAALLALAAGLAGTGLAALSSESDPVAPDAAAQRVITAAKTHLGERYVWGGAGPDSWDCSGFTSTMWREFGEVASIPRVSQAQAAWAIPVAAEDALPGDLVFFDQPVTHVSLYLGRGRIIDASAGRGAVVIREVWSGTPVSYGRVPRPTAPPVRVVHGSVGSVGAGGSVGSVGAGGSVGLRSGAGVGSVLVLADGKPNAVPAFGFVSRVTPRPVAARAAGLAREAVGAPYAGRGLGPAYDAGGLVSATWRRAGGRALPTTAAALERRTSRVRVRDVAPGDLVFYGSPAVHVGIYVGGGLMVDASRVLLRVVLRPVFVSDTVRFARVTSMVKQPAVKQPAVRRPPRRTAPDAGIGRRRPGRHQGLKPARRPRGQSAPPRTSPSG